MCESFSAHLAQLSFDQWVILSACLLFAIILIVWGISEYRYINGVAERAIEGLNQIDKDRIARKAAAHAHRNSHH